MLVNLFSLVLGLSVFWAVLLVCNVFPTPTLLTAVNILFWSLSQLLRHACTHQPPLFWGAVICFLKGALFWRGPGDAPFTILMRGAPSLRRLPPIFPFLSLTRSLALSSHTASVTTEGFPLQGTLACYFCWVSLNKTHSKDVFAVELQAIHASWRSLWLLFFEAWSACLSNLEIKPGARSMPGSSRERPGKDGLHLSGERWCK